MDTIAFIGGGNMASAIIGGLVRSGRDAAAVLVVDPGDAARTALQAAFPGIVTVAAADERLRSARLVVWAVKPQYFQAAAVPCAAHVGSALHLSVMAGIRSDAIAQATGSERIVRAMPNTPALIGQGISGLFARDAVAQTQRSFVEQVLAPTGDVLWVEREEQLDAVTALSGSGPAYVFYFIEAMMQAGSEFGLQPEQARRLALATFSGASALAAASNEAPQLLRERVTSKGGTTHAAISSLEADRVKASFVKALHAARSRAHELGQEFGRS
jgi:pyrroline-5-carboxylate reductase